MITHNKFLELCNLTYIPSNNIMKEKIFNGSNMNVIATSLFRSCDKFRNKRLYEYLEGLVNAVYYLHEWNLQQKDENTRFILRVYHDKSLESTCHQEEMIFFAKIVEKLRNDTNISMLPIQTVEFNCSIFGIDYKDEKNKCFCNGHRGLCGTIPRFFVIFDNEVKAAFISDLDIFRSISSINACIEKTLKFKFDKQSIFAFLFEYYSPINGHGTLNIECNSSSITFKRWNEEYAKSMDIDRNNITMYTYDSTYNLSANASNVIYIYERMKNREIQELCVLITDILTNKNKEVTNIINDICNYVKKNNYNKQISLYCNIGSFDFYYGTDEIILNEIVKWAILHKKAKSLCHTG